MKKFNPLALVFSRTRTVRLLASLKLFADFKFRQFGEFLEFPVKVVLSPFTLPFEIAGSAPRGFGIPEFISKLSAASVFAVAALGTYVLRLILERSLYLRGTAGPAVDGEHCAVPCAEDQGSGERPTARHVADAIVDNRAELVHLPSSIYLNSPLPLKDCPKCDGTGVMDCPECENKLGIKISADDLVEPPWKAFDVLRKMDYPYEHIVHCMKDPSIAAFWLLTFPQVMGGFDYDADVKQKIWWQYKESMQYDQLRDVVAKRSTGWEHLQQALIALDPERARVDPVVVKNVSYYKAVKAQEAEVLKLDPPPRPNNWGELDLPLSASSWSNDDLKDPAKLYEMNVLLNAQREMADKILDAQWETKWRQDKLNKMLEDKIRPVIQNIENAVLPQPIVGESSHQDHK